MRAVGCRLRVPRVKVCEQTGTQAALLPELQKTSVPFGSVWL